MHTYDLNMTDIDNVFSTTTDIGTKINSGAWLLGFVGQQVAPPTQMYMPITNEQAKEYLIDHVRGVKPAAAIPWGTILKIIISILTNVAPLIQ